MSVATYTKTGAKATSTAKLDKDVFGVEVKNHELLKLAYVAHLANARSSAAKTKTRGEVRGGGKKPWKQKGTGRARFGSSRNPIWRGGGIAFGPTGLENHTKQISTTMKRVAIRQALSMAAQENRIKVIENLESKEGKTQAMTALLSKLEATGNILIITDGKDDMVVRATSNLGRVKVVTPLYTNVYDLMNADTVLVSERALAGLNTWLATPKATKPAKETK